MRPETKTTPVIVIKGCLICPHHRETPGVPICPDWPWTGCCTHQFFVPYDRPRLNTSKGDIPPDWCPLPKLGDTVEVRE